MDLRCSKCNEKVNKTDLAKKRTICKPCQCKEKALYKEKNKEHIKAYKQENKEKTSAYNKKYREEHLEQLKLLYNKSDEEKNENIKKRQTEYYNEYKNLVEKKNGVMMSTVDDYINAHSKLKIKCCNNHEFDMTYNNFSNNKWCPQCQLHQNELITLNALEHLFDKTFIKCRPDWLINKENNRLEIDCFNEELKLCVEYNGIQHYKFTEFFHKTEEYFMKRQEDDKIKEQLCIDHGYNFIIVPYTVATEEIIKYLADKCGERNIVFDKTKILSFDISEIDVSGDKHKKLLEIIKNKGGQLLEGRYITGNSDITVMCDKAHIWLTKTVYIMKGAWCHICGLTVKEETKEKISNTLTTYYQTDIGIAKTKHIIEKRSITMKNQRDEIRKELKEKVCKKCETNKQITEFSKKSDTKDGYQPYCRCCINIIKMASRHKN
jgi:hypothetical protein